MPKKKIIVIHFKIYRPYNYVLTLIKQLVFPYKKAKELLYIDINTLKKNKLLVLTNRFDISTVFDISVFEISKFNCNIVCSLSCFTCGIFRLISLDFQFVGVQLHRLNYKLQGAFETNEVFFSRQSKKKILFEHFTLRSYDLCISQIASIRFYLYLKYMIWHISMIVFASVC